MFHVPRLDVGSADLRKAANEPVVATAKPVWSKAEEASYKAAFAQLLPYSSNKPALDADPMAEYLKTSGLPRKVLREVWRASVTSPACASFEEFCCCCRLIAHCQEAMRSPDLATREMMEQAGLQLRQLLQERFLMKVPSTLPEFKAHFGVRQGDGDWNKWMGAPVRPSLFPAAIEMPYRTLTTDCRRMDFLGQFKTVALLSILLVSLIASLCIRRLAHQSALLSIGLEQLADNSSRDETRLRQALQSGKLLEVEVRWGYRELAAIQAKASADEVDEPIRSIEEILAEEDERQRLEEEEMAALERQREAELESQVEAASKQVQAAISTDDQKELLKILEQYKGILPDEQVAAARRRLPGMWARAEMRKELAQAMSTPENTQKLKFAIASATRSCLPQAEVQKAQDLLNEMELQKAKVDAEGPARTDVPSAPVQVQNKRSGQPEAPQSKLEQAVLAKDKELIQAALSELKASGMSTRERTSLYTAAQAKFGARDG
ncbi:unnamed protein product [Effrenium voratum]|nr:unnamed protein product [Effrenium voratum]